MIDRTGDLEYTLKNNYLFIALMNTDLYSLKMLICALLGMKMGDIKTLTIRNPIEVGKAVKDKTYILDIAIVMNDDAYINIELQVVNYDNWPERSLSYLCRTYDNLNRGKDYQTVLPAIHVSILDFTLFEDSPEFFSEYRMLNVRNYREYTSKFQLYVLDLTKMNLATERDKVNKLDVWAALFRAKTWGDLMSIVKENGEFEKVVNSIDVLTADEQVRLQCEAQERFIIHEREMQNRLIRQLEQIEEQQEQIEEQQGRIEEQQGQIEEQQERIEQLEQELSLLKLR